MQPEHAAEVTAAALALLQLQQQLPQNLVSQQTRCPTGAVQGGLNWQTAECVGSSGLQANHCCPLGERQMRSC